MIALALSGVPIVRRVVDAPLYAVPLCGSCGTAASAPNARTCTRTDCSLSDRYHDRNDSATKVEGAPGMIGDISTGRAA